MTLKSQNNSHAGRLPVSIHRDNLPANSHFCLVLNFQQQPGINVAPPLTVCFPLARRTSHAGAEPAELYAINPSSAGHLHARLTGVHESPRDSSVRVSAHSPQPTGVQRCRGRAPRVPFGTRFSFVAFAGGFASCTGFCANRFRSQKRQGYDPGPKKHRYHLLILEHWLASPIQSKPSNPWALLLAPRAAPSRLGSMARMAFRAGSSRSSRQKSCGRLAAGRPA